MASGVKQWSPRQWVEFVRRSFFFFSVTHRTGEGNGHIYASGWDELWDVIFYKRLHGWSLGILDESELDPTLVTGWSHLDSSPEAVCWDPLQHLRRRLRGVVKKLSGSCEMLLGTICFLRGWGMHPYDSIPWRRKSIMKILSFDNTLEYVPQGSDSTENFMTRMTCPWSSFVWYVEIHTHIHIYIYTHQYHAKQLDEVGAGHNTDWLYEHLELANDGHYYIHIYIYTMYILVLYLFNIFGLCIYKIRARGNCIDTHSLLSLLAIRLSGYQLFSEWGEKIETPHSIYWGYEYLMIAPS